MFNTQPGSYAVPPGLGIVLTRHPALKRWAEICCPLRGRELRQQSQSRQAWPGECARRV